MDSTSKTRCWRGSVTRPTVSNILANGAAEPLVRSSTNAEAMATTIRLIDWQPARAVGLWLWHMFLCSLDMMHMFHRDAVASPALRPGSLRPGVRSLRARLGQNSLCRSGAGGQM